MTLEEKLRKIKHLEKDKTQSEWDAYKKQWIKDISLLQHIVMYKWFEDFSKQGLMEFDIIPTKRVDQYISEYLTTYLKITLANNKSFILSPVSGITTEYDGELEFYMQGNFDKKIGIFRKLVVEQAKRNKSYIDNMVPEDLYGIYSKKEKMAYDFSNALSRTSFESSVVSLVASFEKVVFSKYKTSYGTIKEIVRDSATERFDYTMI
jgi:hypothetical protein